MLVPPDAGAFFTRIYGLTGDGDFVGTGYSIDSTQRHL